MRGVVLTLVVFLATGELLLACGGCAESAAVTAYQSRPLVGMAAEDAFNAALPLMRREFGRVSADRSTLTIVAAPQEYSAARDAGTARDLVGARTSLRRCATLRIRKQGEDVVAEVRVDVERKEPARRVLAPAGSRVSDLPAFTPIERDAATTEAQNSVWVRLRRDQGLERALLNELRDVAATVGEAGEKTSGGGP